MSIVTSFWRWLASLVRRRKLIATQTVTPSVPPPPPGGLTIPLTLIALGEL